MHYSRLNSNIYGHSKERMDFEYIKNEENSADSAESADRAIGPCMQAPAEPAAPGLQRD